MKTTLYMAMSVNGIIVKENGNEDFLSHKNWETFTKLANKSGNFIVGRKTYEAAKNWNEDYDFDSLTGIIKVVISENPSFELDKDYILANSPKDAVEKLKQEGFENILVTGGSTTNTAFIKANLLDEIILNIEPAILGKGIPLFSSEEFESKLNLIGVKKLENDIIQLHYKIEI